MISIPFGRLAAAAMEVKAFSQILNFALRRQDREPAGVLLYDDISNVRGIDALIQSASQLQLAAESLDMPVTLHYARGFQVLLAEIPRLEDDTGHIVDPRLAELMESCADSICTALKTEADQRVAVVVPAEKMKFYAPEKPLFGVSVAEKFPRAIYDIGEAGKCLALARASACVFHLMHVVEIALKAVHACLGLIPPDNPSWGIWLKQIRDERVRRGDRKWEENDYFQDIYSKIDAIKDAHRDPTIHVQTIHTEEEAALIFESTKALMKRIASRMEESGKPFA